MSVRGSIIRVTLIVHQLEGIGITRFLIDFFLGIVASVDDTVEDHRRGFILLCEVDDCLDTGDHLLSNIVVEVIGLVEPHGFLLGWAKYNDRGMRVKCLIYVPNIQHKLSPLLAKLTNHIFIYWPATLLCIDIRSAKMILCLPNGLLQMSSAIMTTTNIVNRIMSRHDCLL